jgi:acetolactate decarboxylase
VVDVIGDVITSENYLYAVRITGEFDWIRTRTAARQAKPYRHCARPPAANR